jgi:hypothetical protein
MFLRTTSCASIRESLIKPDLFDIVPISCLCVEIGELLDPLDEKATYIQFNLHFYSI